MSRLDPAIAGLAISHVRLGADAVNCAYVSPSCGSLSISRRWMTTPHFICARHFCGFVWPIAVAGRPARANAMSGNAMGQFGDSLSLRCHFQVSGLSRREDADGKTAALQERMKKSSSLRRHGSMTSQRVLSIQRSLRRQNIVKVTKYSAQQATVRIATFRQCRRRRSSPQRRIMSDVH